MEHIAQIEDNLFLGSLFAAGPTTLEKYGITYIFHIGFEIPKPNLKTNYFRTHCKHEYFDLEDDPDKTEEMLRISYYIVNKIEKLINEGERVLVCCIAGKSRSASMIVLYLHYKYPAASYEEIIDYIRKHRDISINKEFEKAIQNKFSNK